MRIYIKHITRGKPVCIECTMLSKACIYRYDDDELPETLQMQLRYRLHTCYTIGVRTGTGN